MNRRRWIILLLLVLIGSTWLYFKWQDFSGSNVPAKLENPYLHIPSGTDFEELVELLNEGGFLISETAFRETAALKKYDDDNILSGRYKIEPGWSNRRLINHLQGGNQATIQLVLNSARLLEDVAEKAAEYLEVDQKAIYKTISNPAKLQEYGYSTDEAMCIFIPNTYDFYWNSPPEKFLERMVEENKKFWARQGRSEKARQLDLTPKEVYILASIVEKETRLGKEKPRVAGLYLNRLERGIRLQADPTAVFATKDFTARRVLNYHINFDSPYNTYKYEGLPPGPICMPSIASIDAVLNAEEHDYLYMCAKPDNTGAHAFAKTLKGHNQNAARYRRWLNKQGIRR